MGRLSSAAQRFHIHHEAMILQSYLDPSGCQIFDRLIEAAVAEL
jgi:hypothetical protein